MMRKPYGATLKYFFIIILWLLNTEITRGHPWSLVVIRGHPWSLVVTRGHSWSFVVTRGHSCVLLDKTLFETRLGEGVHSTSILEMIKYDYKGFEKLQTSIQ
jgi:hypothetical protein